MEKESRPARWKENHQQACYARNKNICDPTKTPQQYNITVQII
jgi:hypothetical protein